MRVPRSTYRLQLHAGFGFRDAARIIPYLAKLGISDVYTSPYFRAEKGSTHGYNLVDHNALNPELGGDEGHSEFAKALRTYDLGHVLDVVPNHMGIATGENAYFNDVLENGVLSSFAEFFDIEWEAPKPSIRGRVLLPILGDQYGAVLEAGQIPLRREGGGLVVRYFEHVLPAAPESWLPILKEASTSIDLWAEDPVRMELESVMTELEHLPRHPKEGGQIEADRALRSREKEVAKRRIDALCNQSEIVSAAIDEAIRRTNGVPGQPRTFDPLDAFLRDQHFRLASWRVAGEEINYRRFFDINALAAIRMEEPIVFEATHRLLARLLETGIVTGVRLDHTDGLYDPAEYFDRLQALAREATKVPGEGGGESRGAYIVAEKILERGETLPEGWAIEGTTGYDFLAAASGLFVDAAAEKAFTALTREVTGSSLPFTEFVYEAKRQVMRSSFSSEMHLLALELERLAAGNRRSRDFTFQALRNAIIQTIAAFPVYRTYIRPDGTREPHDERHLEFAIRRAKRRTPALDPTVFDFLKETLLLSPGHETGEHVRFAMRFQQLTGPIMAKGVEDTAFYRYVRFVAVNEVGGDPGRFGTSPSELHAQSLGRRMAFRRGMIATSTHDTKRGEDVRARLAVLSEMPDAWREAVLAMRELAAPYRTTTAEGDVYPQPEDELHFFQTVVGAWPMATGGAAQPIDPVFRSRVLAFMDKAIKEAKRNTSWVNSDAEYEGAVGRFCGGLLTDAAFAFRVRELHARIVRAGVTNSLSQVVLKFASPGVPDTYQGAEGWNLSLVDPDNRRKVDYERLAETLSRVTSAAASPGFTERLLGEFEHDALKVHVTARCLAVRNEHPELLLEGSYEPVDAGPNVFAFVRRWRNEWLLAAVPRLVLGMLESRGVAWPIGGMWREGTVRSPSPPLRGEAVNIFGGPPFKPEGDVPLERVFASFPVALFVSS